MKLKFALFLPCVWLIILNSISYANVPSNHQVCFLPEQACLIKISKIINQAKESIYLQANNLTSDRITRALVNAEERGVAVKILLDKSQWQVRRYSASRYLISEGIPVWIDFHDDFANTNLIIVDKRILIIGGLNYHEKQCQNISDHVLFIENNQLAQIYLNQWMVRKNAAKKLFFPISRDGQAHQEEAFDIPTVVKVFMQFNY